MLWLTILALRYFGKFLLDPPLLWAVSFVVAPLKQYSELFVQSLHETRALEKHQDILFWQHCRNYILHCNRDDMRRMRLAQISKHAVNNDLASMLHLENPASY